MDARTDAVDTNVDTDVDIAPATTQHLMMSSVFMRLSCVEVKNWRWKSFIAICGGGPRRSQNLAQEARLNLRTAQNGHLGARSRESDGRVRR